MSSSAKQIQWGKKLVHKMTCPNCWHTFYPEEVLFIASHPEAGTDPIAGGDSMLRFEPTRFTVSGEAIDPKGFTASQLACPRCHLQVPEGMTEVAPLFVSLIGSPASGKSYFLTTMTWQLRTLMPQFELSFSDADPVGNAQLHQYEESLFLNPHRDRPTEIRKTEQDVTGHYQSATLEGIDVRFPRPMQFTLWPTAEHPSYYRAHQIGRIAVLYDNAGEDFLPGQDDGRSATVQHMAKSQIFFVMFDPTQDPRFRDHCHSDDPQLTHGLRPDAEDAQSPIATRMTRQETLVKEAAVRIRKYLGMSMDKRLRKPVIVIVPKLDIWENLLDEPLEEPYIERPGQPSAVRLKYIEAVSNQIRQMLRRWCPEFVASVESFSEVVSYVPLSSLGTSPEVVSLGDRTFYGIRPKDIKPKWVTVPLAYCLAKYTTGMMTVGEKDDSASPEGDSQ